MDEYLWLQQERQREEFEQEWRGANSTTRKGQTLSLYSDSPKLAYTGGTATPDIQRDEEPLCRDAIIWSPGCQGGSSKDVTC